MKRKNQCAFIEEAMQKRSGESNEECRQFEEYCQLARYRRSRLDRACDCGCRRSL